MRHYMAKKNKLAYLFKDTLHVSVSQNETGTSARLLC